MADYSPYDYSKSALPRNPRWEKAATQYHKWVTDFMGHKFSPAHIDNFMLGQPVAAAQRLLKYCPDIAEEAVTLALLGELKKDILNSLMGDKVLAAQAINDYGQRAVLMIVALANPEHAMDAEMSRDLTCMQMVEDISMMEDQIGTDRKWDKFHDVRWNMVKLYEARLAEAGGIDPALVKTYREHVTRSRGVLEGIDKYKAAQAEKKNNLPKPPGM